ncbi:methyltransferase [Flavonifractor sp. DFI.6.63]|uniref:tRNA1(Val) (adenine(37)-N6)-methyltransferase n=1 Tax=Flavonifractor sp. DFI.6.63 TaxID=2963704 RepID=UPI00210C1755|nr:methyltransferase [Flavonifractor sp. DFI.6.63]MCQ5030669.1 methyltransferase [Flavonifractor sp. DFI.6.63]MDU2195401.1 methyltransferase [Clostridiales bacterium]
MERLGPFTYRQGGFPLGQDTLLLGRFATLRRGGRVCDLGCGAGALPLLLLARESSLDLSGVELDGEAAALARRNLAENGLSGVIRTGDLRRVREQFPAGRFDLVVSNPPYFPAGSGESGGSARMELCCTLTQVCAAAAFLLKNGGRFALVHRPERLAGLMEALGQSGLEPKRLQMVQHDRDKPPSAVLVEAVRQGRPGLSVLPTLILNER